MVALWPDDVPKRDDFLREFEGQMQSWQSVDMENRLRTLLEVKPYFSQPDVRSVRLHLYSAGRGHLGYTGQPWDKEILASECYFRRYLRHNGHVNVTNLYSELRYTWPDGEEHHVSGLNALMQAQLVKHNLG